MKTPKHTQFADRVQRAAPLPTRSVPDPDFSVAAARLTHVEEQMNELNNARERLSKAASALEDRLGPVTHRVPTAGNGGEAVPVPPDSIIAPHANILRNIQRIINDEASRLEALHRSIEL